MRDHARLVVIGAGIVGCSTVYHLTRMGWKDIAVLDQGPLFDTGGSTSHAPGLVFQTNFSKMMTGLSGKTVSLYNALDLDGNPCFYPVGSFEVAYTPERLEDLKRKLGAARSWELEAHLISPEEAGSRLPLLDADPDPWRIPRPLRRHRQSRTRLRSDGARVGTRRRVSR